jgi:hypothetical protein
MKIVSYPPFIVFFDTIAVILFFLILNQNQHITIEITEKKLFKDALIVYKQDRYYYKTTGEEYIRDKEEDDFYYFLDCDKRIFECNAAISKYKTTDVFIVLPDKVYNDISKLTTLAFGKKVCASIKYHIAKTGQIDYLQLQKDNPCLNKLNGFNDLVNSFRQNNT